MKLLNACKKSLKKSIFSKKIILFGLIILVMLASVVSAARILTGDNTGLPIVTSHILRVGMLNQIPDPAEPGKYVDIRFKFENNGSKSLDNIEAEILPQYPFSLDPGTSTIKSLGSINPSQKGDKGVVIKYKLRVDKDALEGENEIKLRYRTNGDGWITLSEFKIDVQPFDAILLLDTVKSIPESIGPGKRAKIEITFSNIAEILLKKIRVKLKLSSAPLAPIGSTNEKVIEKIDKGEKSTLIFDVIAEPDAESGVYTIPVEFVYYDSLGNSYNRNSTIGLIIGSEPDLSVNIDSTSIYQSGKTGEVTVKIVNKGVNDIKFLNIKLAENENYAVTSPNEVYIGNIDSDDYETADFDMFVKETSKFNFFSFIKNLFMKEEKEEKIILPINLEYKDANNKDYTKNVNIELPLYDAEKAKKFGLVKDNVVVGLFIIVLIVIAGIFIYLVWRKKRKR